VELEFDLLSDNDLSMLYEVESAGLYEKSTTLLISSLLLKGDVFVDVGANIGYFSILASRLVGDEGSVFAFEPSQGSIERLEANVDLIKARNVTIIPKAAYSRSGSLPFYLSDIQEGMNSTLKVVKHTASISVPAVTLDSTLGDVRIDLMKIDAEGAEREVLIGSRQILTEGRCRKIILEWYNYPGFTTGDLDGRFDYYAKVGSIYLISNSPDGSSYSLQGPILNRRRLPPACNLLLIPFGELSKN
jgi:FkbM family methyltransferase